MVDLPPGTGDVQISLIQKSRPDGAVIVSTPQDLSLIDATRAVDLFNRVQVPVLGLIENMAGYHCPHCGEDSDPFGTGGAEAGAARDARPVPGPACRCRWRSAQHPMRAARRPSAMVPKPSAFAQRSPSRLLDALEKRA